MNKNEQHETLAIFLANLDHAIKFHQILESDPHNIQNAVICSLLETKEALNFAMKGERTPLPTKAK